MTRADNALPSRIVSTNLRELSNEIVLEVVYVAKDATKDVKDRIEPRSALFFGR